MKASTRVTETTTIELTDEESDLLRGILQNACAPDDPLVLREFVRELFDSLPNPAVRSGALPPPERTRRRLPG